MEVIETQEKEEVGHNSITAGFLDVLVSELPGQQLFVELLMRNSGSNVPLVLVQFVSDYSGQPGFVQRAGPDGLHKAEKEGTVSNILQTIRSCHRSLEIEEPTTADGDPASGADSPASRRHSLKDRYKNP